MPKFTAMSRICFAVIILSVIIQYSHADLVHRYSFSGNVNDSVGSAHGTLLNNTGNAAFENGQLILGNDGSQSSNNNNGDYLDLPNGIISALGDHATFEAWTTWRGSATWERIFDFGTSDGGEDESPTGSNSYYIFLTPQGGPGVLRFGMSNPIPSRIEITIDNTAVLPQNTEQHVAITWDGANRSVKMYLNGNLVNQGQMHFALSDITDNNNWLGRSQWPDAMYVGSYNEFRIYDSALTAEEIEVSFIAGADNVSAFGAASNPAPVDGETEVELDATLYWESDNSAEIVSHDIYLGTNRTVVDTATTNSSGIYQDRIDANLQSYKPVVLDMDTTYYWRVDEVADDGYVVRGNIWSFHTENYRASDPNPKDEASGIYTGIRLLWESGKDAAAHNVYMGLSPQSLIEKQTNLDQAVYDPGELDYATKYYWRIDEVIPDSSITTGIVWSFTTQQKPASCLPGDLDGDCAVDFNDLVLLAKSWMEDTACIGFDCPDLDQNQRVDMADFAMLAENWQNGKLTPVVINEIHYHPDNNVEPVEFIELYNAGVHTVDISEWRLSGGISFSFGENTSILPGGFLVVGENPEAIMNKFDIEALGPFEGRLSNEGDRVVLRNANDEKIDEVEYKNEFPWPISADGEGASMELINPGLDNDLGGSWRPSGYGSPNASKPPEYFIESQSDQWHWRKGTSEPDAGWQDTGHLEDQTWNVGQTSIGYGDDDDNTILGDMRNKYVSVYLRHEFYIENTEDIPLELDLNIYVDDGCIVWLNGKEVKGFHVTSTDLPYDVSESFIDNHECEWETYKITNPETFLQVGKNMLAIHAVNDGAGSSDFSIDASLYAVYETGPVSDVFGPSTPGAVNRVYSTDSPPQIRQVRTNPIQPAADEPFTITAKITDPDGVDTVELHYQIVLPGHYIPAYLPVEHDALLANPSQPRPVNPAFENPANWTTIEMTDDGSAGDAFAGDDIYTAIIGGQTNRTLVRYRITAEDSSGNGVRVPYFDDPSLNFACFVYNGVPPYTASTRSVHPEGAGHTYSSELLTSIPVYQMITRQEDMRECYAYNGSDQQPHTDVYEHQEARRAYNWEGAFVYDGQVHDHIGYRLRGANGRYQLAGKRSMRFRFNRGNYLQARNLEGKKYSEKWKFLVVGKMFGNRQVGNFGLAEILNMQLWNMVGVPANDGYWFHFRVIDGEQESPSGTNGQYYGDFWGMFLAFENYDVRFIESRDLPKANLYKLSDRVFEGLRQLRYQGPDAVTGAEDYENIRWNLNASATSQWIQDHLDCDEWYRYHAVSEAIRHYDVFSGPVGRHTLKNMAWYFYPDYGPENNNYGKLWFIPYDTDDTWGPFWNYGTDHAKVAIFEVDHANNPIGPGKPELKKEYRNTIREFRDIVWQQDSLNPMIDDLYDKISEFVPADRDRWKDAPSDAGRMDFGSLEDKVADMKRFAWEGGKAWPGDPSGYIGSAAHLDALASAEGEDDLIPKTPVIKFLGPEGYPINRMVFETNPFFDPQGSNTFEAFKWRLAEVTDEDNPNYNPKDKRKFEIESLWQSGEITGNTRFATVPGSVLKTGHSYRVRCRAKDDTGRWSHWSNAIQFIAGDPVPEDILNNLRITEVMYNPAAESNNNDYEFIELKNIGAVNLDLSRVEFAKGVTFQFSAGRKTTLAPGAFVLVVRNETAFESRYGNDMMAAVAGEYSGGLSDSGEEVVLQDTLRGVIVSFEYNDSRGWPQSADGPGHSLVPISTAVANQNQGTLDYGGNWRASSYIYGSPGFDDPVLNSNVIINEFAAHTDYDDPGNPDYDSNDWIELHNVSPEDVTLNNWYLSDNKDDLKKWHIGNITVPASGFVTFDEVNDFHNPIILGFGLDKAGEEIVLSYLPGDGTDRIVDFVQFKGQDNNTSSGRYPDGEAYWFAMTPSPDFANALPYEHPVIRQVMYNPDIDGEEFIKLYNPTSDPVALSGPAGGWRLNGEVDYVFNEATVIQPGEGIIIVDFDPSVETSRLDNFINKYGTGPLVPGVDILGSWSGDVSNGGGRIVLEKPLEPDLPDTSIPWVIIDEVIYSDTYPWPKEADGLGSVLQRLSSDAGRSGNDPANWESEIPMP